jgi:hypothetical protein
MTALEAITHAARLACVAHVQRSRLHFVDRELCADNASDDLTAEMMKTNGGRYIVEAIGLGVPVRAKGRGVRIGWPFGAEVN